MDTLEAKHIAVVVVVDILPSIFCAFENEGRHPQECGLLSERLAQSISHTQNLGPHPSNYEL